MAWKWPNMWAAERGGWWRMAITLALWAAGMVAGIALTIEVMAAGLREALRDRPEYVGDIVLQVVSTPAQHGLALLACLLGIRFVHRQPVRRVWTDGRSPGVGLGIRSACVWALLWFAGTILLPGGWGDLVRRAGEVPAAWWPALSAVTLAAIVLQAANEEVVFRGYVLTRLTAWVKRPWIAIGLMTLLFTSLHLHTSWPAKICVAAMAIALGMGCIRSGTLAPLIGMHAMNNALNRLWLPRATNADVTWLDCAVALVQLLLWMGWLFWATAQKPRDRIATQVAVTAHDRSAETIEGTPP